MQIELEDWAEEVTDEEQPPTLAELYVEWAKAVRESMRLDQESNRFKQRANELDNQINLLEQTLTEE